MIRRALGRDGDTVSRLAEAADRIKFQLAARRLTSLFRAATENGMRSAFRFSVKTPQRLDDITRLFHGSKIARFSGNPSQFAAVERRDRMHQRRDHLLLPTSFIRITIGTCQSDCGSRYSDGRSSQ
jgi:hypothetical protein